MSYKSIGKIQGVRFGYGGYDDAMIGLSLSLGSDKESWGVGDFKGTWGMNPSKHAKWTEADQTKHWGDTVRFIRDLLKQAKKSELNDLVGIPVECTFDGMGKLESWRILEEAI